MSRPDRWWRPSTRRRPPQRARARRMFTEKEWRQTLGVGPAGEDGPVSDEEFRPGDDFDEIETTQRRLEELGIVPQDPADLLPPLPCPPWCVVDHDADDELEMGMRECAGASPVIARSDDPSGDYQVRVFRLYDRMYGKVTGPEVRVGNATFTAEAARQLAAGILNAADQADEQ